MIQSLIIEDEKPSARRLQRMLEKENLKVIASLSSVEDSLEWFQGNEHPELIFLDIQLSDGLSFEIFDKLAIRSSIIFTTAYDEYALKAFKLNSIDYLMKPIDEDELRAALEKYKRNQPVKPEVFDIGQLRALMMPTARDYKKRFSIQVGQHLKLLSTEDITCFYSENKGTYVHCTNNRSYLMENSLDKLEPELDPREFFRVNRQFIVRLENIADIVSYSNQRLEVRLKNYKEQQVIVSRERVKGFKEWLG